ncbi:UNVERIFIED_CONTAM: hypothetical protein Sradi_5690100 [Sesamum radiatum]|uniref:Uncharacterized protein n=1 Tax=Sesamum radiatum TaxID=300843 RepID=A0AAW2L4J4_SESRA
MSNADNRCNDGSFVGTTSLPVAMRSNGPLEDETLGDPNVPAPTIDSLVLPSALAMLLYEQLSRFINAVVSTTV